MPKPGSRVLAGLPAIKPLSWTAFGLAICTTSGALVVRLALGYLDPHIPLFATFFASILITAILAGVGAGLLAAALGLASALWIAGSIRFDLSFGSSVALYLLTALVIIWVADQYRAILRQLQQRQAAAAQQLALITAENNLLEQLLANAALPETLAQLTSIAEDYSEGEMLASVLLMDEDGRHLRHGAAPSLPDAYNRAIDGIEIGPSVGSCGTAAFRKEPVYVTDIQSDPLWSGFRELAKEHGLAACWSVPIVATNGAVLGTFALYHRHPRVPSPFEKEVVELLARIGTIAIEYNHDREQRKLLVDELAHRVRNILAVVMSIASTTLRSKTDPINFKAFQDRLTALATAQRLLTNENWSSVCLRDLVREVAVEPFSAHADRLLIAGAPINIPARLVLPFALTLHELCTNAAKYGALSGDKGRVHIRWNVEGERDGCRNLVFEWSETGGPPVAAPASQGFGSRLLKSAFGSEAEETAEIDYRLEGIVCKVKVPIQMSGVEHAEGQHGI